MNYFLCNWLYFIRWWLQQEDSAARMIYNVFMVIAHPQQPVQCQAGVSQPSAGGTRFSGGVRSKQNQCGEKGGMTKMLNMSLGLTIPLGADVFKFSL